MSEEFQKIINYVQEHKCQHIGIFAHQNADPDAIASAIGLKYLILSYFPLIHVTLYASSLSLLSQKILSNYDEKFEDNIVQNNLDAIFLCDTNNLIQLGDISIDEYISNNVPVFIIDHHSYHEFTKQAIVSIVKPITSTAEIIAQIYKETAIQLPENVGTILLSGVLFDTRRFIHTSPATFELTQFLIANGGNYDTALSILQKPFTKSERIAHLKGAKRMIIHYEDRGIVVVSHVGSYESSVARSLVNLGSDFAVVFALTSSDELRISFRCSNNYASKTAINLGELANKIATKFGGTGGGHKTAAGANIKDIKEFPKNKDKIAKFLLNILLEELELLKET